jgi:mono/diheme cytochrome c family protein
MPDPRLRPHGDRIRVRPVVRQRPGGPELRPLDPQLIAEGREVFRNDTFGNEAFWTDTARMHEVIAASVTPALALEVGLKVDADGANAPVVIPPAYGLHGGAKETYSAEGSVSYWNAYVAVTQMHGRGAFSDSRLGIAVSADPDLVTSKLPALAEYQLSLHAPPAPGAVDTAAVARGESVFRGQGRCATCHLPDRQFTDIGPDRLHEPGATGMDPAYAARTATKRYRTTPLRALWQHPPYFHDGGAGTLDAVVRHYDRALSLRLSAQQQADLVAYLGRL